MKHVAARATGSRRGGPPAAGAGAASARHRPAKSCQAISATIAGIAQSASASRQSIPREPRDDRLRELSDLLHASPADNSTLVELGRRVGASQRTLTRLFHEELGMGFRQWRTQLRLHLALVLLADGHTVTYTAATCGWANPTSFIEAFAAVLGRTPGHYRVHPQPR